MNHTLCTFCRLIAVSTMLAAGPAALAADFYSLSADLPPDGTYLNEGPITYTAPGVNIVIKSFKYTPKAVSATRTPSGSTEMEAYNFAAEGTADVTLGAQSVSDLPFTGSGPAQTSAANKVGNTTGAFDTEMLAMVLTGSSGLGSFGIRESPALASTGKTTIDPVGTKRYKIGSFFDIFTEITLDGGNTWIPSSGATRITLQPNIPPAPVPALTAWGVSALLFAVAALGALAIRRQRRTAATLA
jgi:hypothetical protein